MPYDTDAFRARYRANIHPRYDGWLHGGFVFTYAAAWLVFYASKVRGASPIEWLAVPATLVFFNWGEYTVHRSFGHRKHPLGKLFYARHTGDHHSFFVEGRMRYEQARDWRVILFPAWLIVLYSLALALPAYLVFGMVSESLGALVAGTLLLGYLTYELFHSCQHLPDEHPLAKLPWVRTMRRHHAIHHRRGLMRAKNFNLVFPLMDVLYGTLYREGEDDSPSDAAREDDDAHDHATSTQPSP